MAKLDKVDRTILEILQQEGRISNAELARKIDLSPPAAHARTRRLEEGGFISQYVALLDQEKVGFDMICFVMVSLAIHKTEQVESFRKSVQDIPEVLECHHITGEYDYLLKAVIRNRKDLEKFIIENLTSIPGVARIHTSLVLSEVKVTTALPLT